MMNPRINFRNLVRQNLPAHKRQPGRLWLFRALISPLTELFADFERWRGGVRVELNMTGQVGVLEGYLRAKYNAPSIRIENYPQTGLKVGLGVEGAAHAVRVGMGPGTTDGGAAAMVPIRGEIEVRFDDADFVIYVPASFGDRTIEDIRRDVNRYKQALVKYKILR